MTGANCGIQADLTDAEWAQVAPVIPPARRGGNRRHVDEREVVNGLMYILSTGCQWRAIPKDLPARSTLYDYFGLVGRAGWVTAILRGAPPAPGMAIGNGV